MIQFHQVSKYFAGKRAVDNLSLQISKGEFTVLIGTSGSGKSTTLKMINRLIEHDEGKIRFAGEEIRNYKPEDLRRRMGYAIQSIGLISTLDGRTQYCHGATVAEMAKGSYPSTCC